jgi:hypothetical protein
LAIRKAQANCGPPSRSGDRDAKIAKGGRYETIAIGNGEIAGGQEAAAGDAAMGGPFEQLGTIHMA